MRKYLFIFFIFITTNAFSAPNNTMSITPAASDGAVIQAADENTRNTAISTAYNAHDHNDIDQTGNTLAVGDATAGTKTIQANNADSNKPFIRYNDTTDVWESSRDGTTIERIVVVTGSTPGHFTLPQTMTNNQIIEYNSSQDRLVSDSPNYMADDDQDTLIQLEESTDEDIIRMDTNGTERWIMTAAGERTLPTQPAFNVVNASEQSDIAVNTDVTVVFGTEIFDQSSDFSSNTFTAPITGKYFLAASVTLLSIDSVDTSLQVRIQTSNRNYIVYLDPRQFAGDILGSYTLTISCLADMDSNDTAVVIVNQSSGTQQIDIGNGNSRFSGYLAL